MTEITPPPIGKDRKSMSGPPHYMRAAKQIAREEGTNFSALHRLAVMSKYPRVKILMRQYAQEEQNASNTDSVRKP